MDAHTSRFPNRTRAKAQTRERVLEGAHLMFEERGYDGLTHRALATAIGVSTGAILSHFPNKPSLLAAVLEKDYAALREAMWSGHGTTPDEYIASVLAAVYAHYRASLLFLRLKLEGLWRDEPELQAFFHREGQDFQNGIIECLLTSGVFAQEEHERELHDCAQCMTLLWAFHTSNLIELSLERVTFEEMPSRLAWQVRLVLPHGKPS
jgi:AcrR family transcriptional regulator